LSVGEAGLVALYTFDEGIVCLDNSSITTLNDLAGGDNKGAIDNFNLDGSSASVSKFNDPALASTISLVNDYNNTADASGIYPVGTINIV
jgi:hypothetical protein